MKITKYEHACLVLEEQGKKLIIDPSDLAVGLQDVSNVVAVVVTHDHFDHFSPTQLARIISENPAVQIFTTPEVSAQMTAYPTVTVTGGYTQTAMPFELAFFGDMHALIHESRPVPHNVGVLVNNTLYYPGDSFTVPEGHEVTVLALPVSGPWLKIGESLDFVRAVKPRACFPTHNALLSDLGQKVGDNWIKPEIEQAGGAYQYLEPGQSIEI